MYWAPDPVWRVWGQRRSIFSPGQSFPCDAGRRSCDWVHCMTLSCVSVAYIGSDESLLHQCDQTGPLWPPLSPSAVGEWAVTAVTSSPLITGSCTRVCIFRHLPSERQDPDQGRTPPVLRALVLNGLHCAVQSQSFLSLNAYSWSYSGWQLSCSEICVRWYYMELGKEWALRSEGRRVFSLPLQCGVSTKLICTCIAQL